MFAVGDLVRVVNYNLHLKFKSEVNGRCGKVIGVPQHDNPYYLVKLMNPIMNCYEFLLYENEMEKLD